MNDRHVTQTDDVAEYSYNWYFEQLYAGLCFFAEGFVKNKDIGEDLVQDAFVKLWEKFNDFHSPDAVKAFLYRSIRNAAINYLKHIEVEQKHLNTNLQELRSEQFFLHQVIEKETHRLIYSAIDELPERCREILLLSINGNKNQEIAEKLNISPNTVKTQKAIAYKELRLKLQDIYAFLSLFN